MFKRREETGRDQRHGDSGSHGSKENEKIVARLYWLEQARIHFLGKIETGLMARKLKDGKG